MQFECNNIKIEENHLGCSICFCEKTICQNFDKLGYENIIQNEEQYLILRRSYAEIKEEEDYLYIETPNSEFSGEFFKIQINLYSNNLLLSTERDTIDINLKLKEEELVQLEFILKKIIGNKGILHFSKT